MFLQKVRIRHPTALVRADGALMNTAENRTPKARGLSHRGDSQDGLIFVYHFLGSRLIVVKIMGSLFHPVRTGALREDGSP